MGLMVRERPALDWISSRQTRFGQELAAVHPVAIGLAERGQGGGNPAAICGAGWYTPSSPESPILPLRRPGASKAALCRRVITECCGSAEP